MRCLRDTVEAGGDDGGEAEMKDYQRADWRTAPARALEKVASEARGFIERADTSPEGIELYRWHWVPEDTSYWRTYLFPDSTHGAFLLDSGAIPDAFTEPLDIIIRPTVWLALYGGAFIARVGWDTTPRTAVLFFAGGGPEPKSPHRATAVSDQGMHALADEGDAQHCREAFGRVVEMLEEMFREQGATAEEWERVRALRERLEGQ